MSGDYEEAIAAAQKAKVLLWTSTGCIQLLDYHYYTALAIAAAFGTASLDRQREWHETLIVHLDQLREWGENCSITFLDKHTLVSGELARIEGRNLDAERLYEEAIRLAREHGFTQNEGIANEVAGRFYLGRGLETVGHACLHNARSCYLRWGADGKVRQLDQLYSGLEEQGPFGATTNMGAPIGHIDLTTVVTALQAVSREIDLGKLIEILMAVAVKHAGAERGLLFLRRGPEHRIEAEAITRGDKVEVILAQALAAPPKFPESVLRYVIRTRERIILDDASAENPFSDDAYVSRRRPRSILCLPLVKQRELGGVLYLENNLAPCVFAPDRLAVLELLAAQAAISLKNAQLYADLQQENSERRKAEQDLRQSTAELNQLQEEVRRVSRTAMMGELTASLAHELNQPLGAILSNAQAVRRFLAAKEPDLTEVKAAIEEIVQDNSRAVETIRNVRALFRRDEAYMSSIDLKQVLLDVKRILAGDAVFKNISFELDLPGSLPTVLGHRAQLVQALLNLVLNAFDAVSENDNGPREVKIRASRRETGRVHIAVRDSGNGIDPEVMPRLFDVFFTTKPKGMGMGLAIVRSIVESHGGKLWIKRNPDRGATLEFDLPVKVDAESRK
jgi:signal transduction histidine kinase